MKQDGEGTAGAAVIAGATAVAAPLKPTSHSIVVPLVRYLSLSLWKAARKRLLPRRKSTSDPVVVERHRYCSRSRIRTAC